MLDPKGNSLAHSPQGYISMGETMWQRGKCSRSDEFKSHIICCLGHQTSLNLSDSWFPQLQMGMDNIIYLLGRLQILYVMHPVLGTSLALRNEKLMWSLTESRVNDREGGPRDLDAGFHLCILYFLNSYMTNFLFSQTSAQIILSQCNLQWPLYVKLLPISFPPRILCPCFLHLLLNILNFFFLHHLLLFYYCYYYYYYFPTRI